ncbi:thiamine pyrophosphate-binding protein [Pseudonocardia spinosispora]|uniref:thiamine pyrophosphate-binding protein n=1 Tax=Pseudonocardia spinosispora TaxID=103441 RepID=UPI000404B48D|nr:5-guanidino-2-oxopentanoate decarboxylase [Pseudonocardia spinosispora]
MTGHRNGGAAVVETLVAHGVDTIFGIPGTHNLELYRPLTGAGIRAITPRHEQGAGYAAEAYARVTGTPGVVITTSGPGLTNVMTAAATAYAESQPMLIVSPGAPTGTVGRDLGQLHETKNSSGAMDDLVRWSRRVADPDEAAEAITAAYESFEGGRPRPVHVEVPVDVLDQPWTGAARRAAVRVAPVPDRAAVRRAAELLAEAGRALLVVGGGAVDAVNEVRTLAEAIGAPVASTLNGKGVLDESHPLAVGASVRCRALQRDAATSDVVLVVGSELGDSDLWEGRITGASVIRLDIERGQLHKNCPADVPLLADAAQGLRAVIDALPAHAPTGSGFERAAELRAACLKETRGDGGDHEEINRALRVGLPADGILAGDSSQVTYLGSAHFFDLPAPRRFCYMPGFATLGYGLPAAIGASVAHPGRPVAALVGDGALMFSVQELATAVELRLPIPIVVADNGGYREIRHQQAARSIAPIGVDLYTPDLVPLAKAFGTHAVRVDEPGDITAHLAQALDADRPTLIHLRTH